ncbi:uncharacterized protein V6R79_016823, partial [Siganus canaliculatus]
MRKNINYKISIQWSCEKGHKGVWESCPSVNGLPENNLLSSAGILFTDTTETEISDWAKQSAYLIPAVQEAYTGMQEEQLAYMKEVSSVGATFDICGDARKESAMSLDSAPNTPPTPLWRTPQRKYVMSELIQISETTSSYMMEPVGFRRGLDRLQDSGVAVDVVTTDCHPSFRKIMRVSYPDLRQQYDPWHVAKGIKEKVMAAGEKKECQDLLLWVKSIANHLLFSCQTSGGDEAIQKRVINGIEMGGGVGCEEE